MRFKQKTPKISLICKKIQGIKVACSEGLTNKMWLDRFDKRFFHFSPKQVYFRFFGAGPVRLPGQPDSSH